MDGRLVFSDENSFESVIKYLYEHQDDPYKLDEISGFTSYLKAFDELADNDFKQYESYPNLVRFVDGNDIGETLEPVVEFELLKSVLNADGIVQIGNVIKKYSNKFVYSTKNVNSIPLLISNRYSSITDVKVTPIQRIETRADMGVDNRAGFFGFCSTLFSWSDKRKTEGQAVSIFEPGGFSEIFLLVRAKRKRFGRWWPRFQRNLAIRGEGNYSQLDDLFGNGSVHYSFNISGQSGYRLKKTIQWSFGIPSPFIFDNNNTYHDCFGDGGCFVIIN